MTLVLGIAGSPRRGGNSELLLDAALEGAREVGAEVRKLVLAELCFGGCRECGGCAGGRDCVVRDDMVTVYGLLERADAIILASPIFFDGLTAQVKAMIDRGQVYWVRKYVLKQRAEVKRPGAVLCTAARISTDFSGALRTAHTWFLTMDMSMASLTFPGFDEKGAILDDPTALEGARALGRSLLQRDEMSFKNKDQSRR